MVQSVRPLMTRGGEPFCAAEVEDLSGRVEATVWPSLFASTRDLWQEGAVVLLHARVRTRGERLTVAVEHVSAYLPGPEGGPGALSEDPATWRLEGASPRGRREPLRAPEAGRLGEPPPPAYAAPAPPAPQRGGNGGAQPLLHIRLRESGDERADQRRLHETLRLVRGAPGAQRALLTVEGVAERITLELPACAATYALVAEINGALAQHGEAEIETRPLRHAGADAL
jgi:hypothetical protein